MEKTATLNLRVNPTVKERAEKVLSQLGVPMSTAIDVFESNLSYRWNSIFCFFTKSTSIDSCRCHDNRRNPSEIGKRLQ